jgi:Flp pilus assembly pilin Flp
MTQLIVYLRSLAGRVPALELRRSEGQALAEYALLIALLLLATIAALLFLGGRIESLFSDIGNAFPV